MTWANLFDFSLNLFTSHEHSKSLLPSFAGPPPAGGILRCCVETIQPQGHGLTAEKGCGWGCKVRVRPKHTFVTGVLYCSVIQNSQNSEEFWCTVQCWITWAYCHCFFYKDASESQPMSNVLSSTEILVNRWLISYTEIYLYQMESSHDQRFIQNRFCQLFQKEIYMNFWSSENCSVPYFS